MIVSFKEFNITPIPEICKPKILFIVSLIETGEIPSFITLNSNK